MYMAGWPSVRLAGLVDVMGQLAGMLVSGAVYMYAGANVVYGLRYCFVACTASAVASTALTTLIRDDAGA
jgi:hypothetical protein